MCSSSGVEQPKLCKSTTALQDVIVVRRVGDAEAAIRRLLDDVHGESAECGGGGSDSHGGVAVVGFDTEWPPRGKGEPQPPTALLQLSSRRVAVLLQLQRWRTDDGFPDAAGAGTPALLADLMLDAAVLKAGQGIGSEVRDVAEELRLPAPVAGAVDTAHFAGRLARLRLQRRLQEESSDGVVRTGLKFLCSQYLGMQLVKDKWVQRSQWDVHRLSRKQVEYAALDAWASREVFVNMAQLYREVVGPAGLPPSASLRDVAAHAGSLCRPVPEHHAVESAAEVCGDPGCNVPHTVPEFNAATGMTPTSVLPLLCHKRRLQLPVYDQVDRLADGVFVQAHIPGAATDGGTALCAANAVPTAKTADARQVAALKLLHSLPDHSHLASRVLKRVTVKQRRRLGAAGTAADHGAASPLLQRT